MSQNNQRHRLPGSDSDSIYSDCVSSSVSTGLPTGIEQFGRRAAVSDDDSSSSSSEDDEEESESGEFGMAPLPQQLPSLTLESASSTSSIERVGLVRSSSPFSRGKGRGRINGSDHRNKQRELVVPLRNDNTQPDQVQDRWKSPSAPAKRLEFNCTPPISFIQPTVTHDIKTKAPSQEFSFSCQDIREKSGVESKPAKAVQRVFPMHGFGTPSSSTVSTSSPQPLNLLDVDVSFTYNNVWCCYHCAGAGHTGEKCRACPRCGVSGIHGVLDCPACPRCGDASHTLDACPCDVCGTTGRHRTSTCVQPHRPLHQTPTCPLCGSTKHDIRGKECNKKVLSLVCRNIPEDVDMSAVSLIKPFSKYGKVLHVEVNVEKRFGRIFYANRESVERALLELNREYLTPPTQEPLGKTGGQDQAHFHMCGGCDFVCPSCEEFTKHESKCKRAASNLVNTSHGSDREIVRVEQCMTEARRLNKCVLCGDVRHGSCYSCRRCSSERHLVNECPACRYCGQCGHEEKSCVGSTFNPNEREAETVYQVQVKNLNHNVANKQLLFECFSHFGKLSSCRMDRNTNTYRISFLTREAVERTLNVLQKVCHINQIKHMVSSDPPSLPHQFLTLYGITTTTPSTTTTTTPATANNVRCIHYCYACGFSHRDCKTFQQHASAHYLNCTFNHEKMLKDVMNQYNVNLSLTSPLLSYVMMVCSANMDCIASGTQQLNSPHHHQAFIAQLLGLSDGSGDGCGIRASMHDFIVIEWHELFSKQQPYLDTHCHIQKLDYSKFDNYYKIPKNYVGCVQNYHNPSEWGRLAQSMDGKGQFLPSPDGSKIYTSFGCHPRMARNYDESSLLQCLDFKHCVGVGEIGLDEKEDNSDTQEHVLISQLKLLSSLDTLRSKALVLHCRGRHERLLQLVKEHVRADQRIHLHCFSGSYSESMEWTSYFKNLYIGVIAQKTKDEVIRSLPLNRLVIETDAPYFWPEQLLRREKTNGFDNVHPSSVIFTAHKISLLKDTELHVVLKETTDNATALYNIDINRASIV